MLSKINISIDDISPHPKSSTKVLDRCFSLIDTFSDIKFTLFVPMAYTRLNDKPYTISKHDKFIETLKSLPKDNFELGWHGYSHGIVGISNNDEFKSLDRQQTEMVIEDMFGEADKAGLLSLFKPIFRPPAFRMSPQAFHACKAKGINTLALFRRTDLQELYAGMDKSFDGKVVFADCNPPKNPLCMKDQVEVVCHACEWDKNYLSLEREKELREFLLNYNDAVQFVFMEDLDGQE